MVSRISKRWLSSLSSRRLCMTFSTSSRKTLCQPVCSSCPLRRVCSPTHFLCRVKAPKQAKKCKRMRKSSSRCSLMPLCLIPSADIFCFYQIYLRAPLNHFMAWLIAARSLHRKCSWKRGSMSFKRRKPRVRRGHSKPINKPSTTGWYLQD